MFRKFASFLSVSTLSLFVMHNACAAPYDTCLKWVVDGIGVHCKSNPEKDVGAIIFFKKLNSAEWHYQSANNTYPFELTLSGPGLEGGNVTEYGQDACSKFCEKYSG